jgi:uncharacterized protein YggT (Ycf19 family)
MVANVFSALELIANSGLDSPFVVWGSLLVSLGHAGCLSASVELDAVFQIRELCSAVCTPYLEPLHAVSYCLSLLNFAQVTFSACIFCYNIFSYQSAGFLWGEALVLGIYWQAEF